MEKKSDYNWYILFVRGGREKKIINNILNILKVHNLEKSVDEFKIFEDFNNSGKFKNLLPGYLFIKCEITKEVLSLIYSLNDVISFLNHSKKFDVMPKCLSPLEVNSLISLNKKKESKLSENEESVKDNFTKAKKETLFNIGDLILIKEGFFKNYRGSISKVDNKKDLVTINVDFLGRLTPVSIKVSDCEKI